MALRQYRHCSLFEMSAPGYDNLIRLILAVLDTCLTQKDNESANNIMLMSFTFFKTEEGGEKTFLQKEVSSHALWQRPDYWKSGIILQID